MTNITNVTCYISGNVVVELVSVCVLHCHMNHVIFQQTQAFCSEIHMEILTSNKGVQGSFPLHC